MPVIKVPVVHKFGIISHCQRLQLQTRLYEEISPEKSITTKSISNPFEVSDEFVEQYNAAMSTSTFSREIKREMKQKAEKILFKIKRRIGLKYNCEIEAHINLALGWTELAILSQCDGSIGKDSLDLLYVSLNTAPISNRAFSVLFYLLETVLYFIQVNPFQLEAPDKHLKWLLIGEIVAVRIYLQCILKLSQGWKEKLENLTIYIKNFKDCYSQYTKFPDLILSFCVIEEITDYLIKNFSITTSTEEDNKSIEISKFDCGSFLWHAVDLSRSFSYSSLKTQLEDCINGIRTCLENNSTLGEWIECYLAIRVIANSACFSETCLDLFISIIQGLTDVDYSMLKITQPHSEKDFDTKNNLEKGSLLLLLSIREFCMIPLLATSSIVRERALSAIAEMIMSKDLQITKHIPLRIQKVAISRIEAILEICERNCDKSSFYVIKNSIWCLLGAIKRKRILPAIESDYCETYGKVLSSMLYSSESNDLPETANNRITKLLIQYLLPVFTSSKDVFTKSPITVGRDRIIHPVQTSKKEQLKNTDNLKKNICSIKEESQYQRHADEKLKNILENYWNQELPLLKKSLDESNLENKKA